VCPFNTDRGDTTYTTDKPYTASTDGAEESTEYKAYRAYMSYSALHGASPTLEPAFQPRNITIHSTVQGILMLTEEQFRVAFKGSPVKRAKYAGLRRNAEAAMHSLAPDPNICKVPT
jgi:hypothetical protein